MSSDVLIYETNSSPLGISYEQWCIRWWNWLLSIPRQINPVYDKNGNFASKNQDNSEVFFLCQTIESCIPIPRRKVIIPKDKKIFMPIINWISFKDNNETDQELIDLARQRINSVGRLEIYVNQKKLENSLWSYRVQPPLFEMVLPHSNILGIKGGKTTLVTDGYWIFFEPLVQDIELTSSGACSLGITEIGVDYHIKLIG